MSTLNKRNPIAKAVKFALLAGASLTALTSPALFAAEEDADEEENTVTVTGSRLKRTDYETSSPVQITSSEDIALSGFTRVEDLLNSLPQIEAGQNSTISNGSSGTANVDLRGMGANRTLVLINGRRLPPGGVFSQAPDINQIPAALVERAEVLTGGGSSVYGSDAIAGVVNFIMKEDFEGVEVNYGVSGYRHENTNSYIQGLMDERGFDYDTGWSGLGGKSRNLDITMGGSFNDGKGHATVYATVRDIEELRQGTRDYSSCALNAAGTSCGGSGNAIVPNFYVSAPNADGSFNWGNWDYWTLDSGSNFIPSSGNIYNYAPVNHFQRPDKRYSLGAFIDYEINEHVRPYMEVSYMRDVTRAQIAESGTFFAFQYNLELGNPIINASQRQALVDAFYGGVDPGDDAEFATYIGKRNVEGGPRSSNFTHNSMRIVVGSDGMINDNWDYDVSLQFGSTTSSQNYVNDFFAPRIEDALVANEYSVFTYQGITPEQARPLTGVGILNGQADQTIFSGYVTGDLGFSVSGDSNVFAVFGAENRKVKFGREADEVFSQGQLLGQGGATQGLNGSFDVQEVFSEVNIPILEGVSGAEMLALDLGYRYSDYSTSGTATTYKVAVDWTVTDEWKVRASYNRAVRAPNVAELFASQGLGLWTGTDPCAGASPIMSASACANTGVTAAQYGNILASPAGQYNGIFGGNPDLDPEESDTVSFGIVGNPFEGFNFSIDHWDIEIEDVIGAIDPQTTVEQCGATGDAVFCNNVTRNAGGSLWLGQSGFVSGTAINLANRHWTGVDISMNYVFEGLGGMWTAKMIGSRMLKKEYDPIPTMPDNVYDCAGEVSTKCFPQPEFRATSTLTYTPEDSFWSVQMKWRHFGKVNYEATVDTLLSADGGIDSQNYFDLVATFEVSDNISLLAGVSNVTDEEPPLMGNTIGTNANTFAGFYDTLGQFVHANVTMRF